MKSNNILHQIISVLVLVIYMISLSPHIILHDHNHDHNHDHSHELSYCDNLFQDSDYNTNCSHQSHVINLKERCHICDHCTNFDKVVFNHSIPFDIPVCNVDIIEIYQSLYLHDETTYPNKSPPYIS